MITEAQFATRLAQEIRKLGIEGIEYDAAHFRLVLGQHQLNLKGAFADYQQAAFWRRHEVIKSYVESVKLMENGLPAFASVKPYLLPRLRERRFYERMLMRGAVSHVARTPFTDSFFLELVYDAPRNLVAVDRGHLDDWGIDLQQGLAIAIDNLRARSKQQWLTPASGVYVSPWRDNHAASRLALSDLIRGLAVKGDPVAVAPHRDLLIITGSKDPDGLAFMAQLVHTNLSQPRLMSLAPLVFDGQRWLPFTHRLGPVKKLNLLAADLEYREQKQVLESIHEERGETLYVAEHQVTDTPHTGKLQSACVWDERRLPALLPRCDVVHFLDAAGRVRTVDWDVVEEMVGPMRVEGVHPERWRVDHFPGSVLPASP
jgi:hypothetical protein